MSKYPLKTPLRYPGGKSKAVKTLCKFYPQSFKEYREPFIGGGSMAIYTAQEFPDMPIWINDLYQPLYNFWIQLRDNGSTLSEMIKEQKQNMLDKLTQESKNKFAKDLFEKYKKEIDNYNLLEKAASFFIMNKCSYSGLTENSTFSVTASNSNFSILGAEKLKKFSLLIKNWKITNLDYSDLMDSVGEDVFLFLDPPYDIKDFLYGKNREMHRGFDHEKFANYVHNCNHKFMITYNLNENILNFYKNYYCREWEIRYSMAHRGEKGTDENIKKELLVTNYQIQELNPLEQILYD